MELRNICCLTDALTFSELVLEVCRLLKINKVNTSSYHLQNGQDEKFNSTLIGMLSKVEESSDKDWDHHLPFSFFAYCVSVHDSTCESPFYLLYGRDARRLSNGVLNQQVSPYVVNIDDYKYEVVDNLTGLWSLAKEQGSSRTAKTSL